MGADGGRPSPESLDSSHSFYLGPRTFSFEICCFCFYPVSQKGLANAFYPCEIRLLFLGAEEVVGREGQLCQGPCLPGSSQLGKKPLQQLYSLVQIELGREPCWGFLDLCISTFTLVYKYV